MTSIPEFCQFACSHADKCRILEPITYDGRNLLKKHAEKIPTGVNLCRHRACKASGLPAAFLASQTTTSIDLIAYGTEEKPVGRYVDKNTWQLYSTNSNGQILPTGQTLHEYVE